VIGENNILLDTFLINQGITRSHRLRLLCLPDYLFFRTHVHKLYREYSGIPRYSIITRKITDQLSFEQNNGEKCSLELLYVVDGATALKNLPFFFQLAEALDMSVVGTKLDFTELPKLRYFTLNETSFKHFQPIIIASNKVEHLTKHDNKGSKTKSVSLSLYFDLFIQSNTVITDDSIAIGSVRELNDFFPTNFDILRINLGDLVEYHQQFDQFSDFKNPEYRKRKILTEVEKIIDCFNIPTVLISLYKLAKFFNYPKNSSSSPKSNIDEICEYLKFTETILIHNEKRRVWGEVNINDINSFYDSQGYLVLYNRSR